MVGSPKWKRVPIDIGKFQNTLATQTGVDWYEKYGEIPSTGYQWRNYLIVQKQEHPKGWFIFIEDETIVKHILDGVGVPPNMNLFIPAGQKWSRLEGVNALFIELGKKSPKWEETQKISGWWSEWTVAYNILLHGKKQGYSGRVGRKGTFTWGKRYRGFKKLNIAKDLCYMIEEMKIAQMASESLLNHIPFMVGWNYQEEWVFTQDFIRNNKSGL